MPALPIPAIVEHNPGGMPPVTGTHFSDDGGTLMLVASWSIASTLDTDALTTDNAEGDERAVDAGSILFRVVEVQGVVLEDATSDLVANDRMGLLNRRYDLMMTDAAFNALPVWASGTDYAADAVVTQFGRVWRARRATTGDGPSTSPVDWENVTLEYYQPHKLGISEENAPNTGDLIVPPAWSSNILGYHDAVHNSGNPVRYLAFTWVPFTTGAPIRYYDFVVDIDAGAGGNVVDAANVRTLTAMLNLGVHSTTDADGFWLDEMNEDDNRCYFVFPLLSDATLAGTDAVDLNARILYGYDPSP